MIQYLRCGCNVRKVITHSILQCIRRRRRDSLNIYLVYFCCCCSGKLFLLTYSAFKRITCVCGFGNLLEKNNDYYVILQFLFPIFFLLFFVVG